MSKHSDGPWRSITEDESGNYEIVCDSRPYVCTVWGGALPKVTKANARLIAAAPELLSVVEMVVEAYDPIDSPPESAFGQIVNAARAAIAKAAGA